jgi:hypothetical protein
MMPAKSVHRKPAFQLFYLGLIADLSKRLVFAVFEEPVGHEFIENDAESPRGVSDLSKPCGIDTKENWVIHCPIW